MSESRFTIRVHRSCPELGLHAGDLVTFVPEIATPDYQLYVHRPLPANPGSLLTMLETGGAELLTPHATVAEFAEAVGWPRPRLVLEQREAAGQPIPDGPIDLEAALEALQRPDPNAPSDLGARDYLTRDEFQRHMTLVRKTWRKMPKLCRHCGGQFLPKLDYEASCPTCKEARHRKCIRCGEQITAGDARAKRCTGCIEKDAEKGA